MNTAEMMEAGIYAVLHAAKLSRLIQSQFTDVQKVSKADRSPVTSADFGAQAVVYLALHAHFKTNFCLIGEEDAAILSLEENAAILDKVVDAVNTIYPRRKYMEKCLSLKKDCDADPNEPFFRDFDSIWTPREILDVIAHCNNSGHESTSKDFWTLDPIDGTKGFLRQGQYAIGLAFIRAGIPLIGIIAAPNAPFDHWTAAAEVVPFIPEPNFVGSLFHAYTGGGSFIRPLVTTDNDIDNINSSDYEVSTKRRITTSFLQDCSQIIFSESFEAGHTDRSLAAAVLQHMNAQSTPPIRIDSMTKFGLLARGETHLLMRLSAAPEMIWDQAPGHVIVHEAGGVVTDGSGLSLDFTTGRRLVNNKYVIVSANNVIHKNVLEALQLFSS